MSAPRVTGAFISTAPLLVVMLLDKVKAVPVYVIPVKAVPPPIIPVDNAPPP